MHSLIDIGYDWPWTHGHLIITALTLPLCWLSWKRQWSRIVLTLLGAVAAWSIAAFLVVQFVFRFNDVPELPTQAFVASGPARVLDLGAGSGRSSLMVLNARPQVTLVALDNFSATYIRGHGAEKTRANFRAAGFDRRATVESGDMRELSFPDASFDAIVSAYAIDHLSGTDIPKTLAEAARVLRPGGEFLLEVMYPDSWMKFAWGPMLLHGASAARMRAAWPARLEAAGFKVVEVGTAPITLYLRAVKPRSTQ
jgi:SAM-dependent methyltransferase